MSTQDTATPIFEDASNNVSEFIDWRTKVYGEPVECFERVALIWTGILGTPVRADQVMLCMIGVKQVRASITPDYSDNSDDIDGYLDIFRRIIGDDMIHASSVASYIEQKQARNG